MKAFDSVRALLEGIRSVIDVSGAIRSVISGSLADGIERAFLRIKKPLEQSVMRISLILAGVFFTAWGAAQFIDNFLPYSGLGFVIVGAFFGMMVLVFGQEKRAEC